MADLAGIFTKVAVAKRNSRKAGAVKANNRKTGHGKVQRVHKPVPPGTEEKILALVETHPEWGTQRLRNALEYQHVSLSRQSVYKILKKYNLNIPSMRKQWGHHLKEAHS
ncbi:helix-turn-helix domain-containing protein [Geobacter sp. FeAm09]|uniref:helix-turn-helix domain-containing protein n=1 Tax=Geobacter sp. FeAm09 TaxID=2597769 RepID=UPI00197A9B1D|nr:helix-turn-helix domain-containing protein [Geobacter sp. FeAm09]